MRQPAADDPEGPWIAVICVGILVTLLAATVTAGLVAFYHAKIDDVQVPLAVFGAGALIMLVAAARLEILAFQRARTQRR